MGDLLILGASWCQCKTLCIFQAGTLHLGIPIHRKAKMIERSDLLEMVVLDMVGKCWNAIAANAISLV